jgi:hypothetical protein
VLQPLVNRGSTTTSAKGSALTTSLPDARTGWPALGAPFYLPKDSAKGQLLAVKEGIGRMLERVDLTDEERAALEGDSEVLTSLAERLADVPTPAGPTPREMGTTGSFIPLTNLLA